MTDKQEKILLAALELFANEGYIAKLQKLPVFLKV